MDQGVRQLSGSASFTHTHHGGDPAGNSTDIRLNPRVGYFVAPGFALTGNLRLSHTSFNGSTVTSYGVGPGVAYYFKRGPAAIHPFLAAGVLYMHDRGSYQGTPHTRTISHGTVRVGFAALLARNVAVTGELYYSHAAYTLGAGQSQLKSGIADYGA